MISSLDYYLYMGKDEGQMGFVDAVAAGVKTIVMPQGYHLDAKNAITHSFDSVEELQKIFLDLQREKSDLVESVSTWNWLDYTRKHVEIWRFLIDRKDLKSDYVDGLNSIRMMQESNFDFSHVKVKEQEMLLRKTKLKYFFKNNLNTSSVIIYLKKLFFR